MGDKKIFKIILLYLKSNAIQNAEIQVPYYSDSFESLSHIKIEDVKSGRNIKLIKEFEEWLDNYIENFDTDVFEYEGVNSGGLTFKIDVENKKMDIILYTYVSATEDYGQTESMSDYDLDGILTKYKNENVKEIIVYYSGGGDSGSLDSMEIDEKNAEIDGRIEDISYNLLENFGGWEINEGSQGEIVFNFKEEEIYINHQWNIEESEEEKIDSIDL